MPAGQGIGTDCAGSLSAIFPVFSYFILISQTVLPARQAYRIPWATSSGVSQLEASTRSCVLPKPISNSVLVALGHTTWQEAPAWIFGSIQSLENEGILYVFLVFQTEEVGQKDGCGSQTQLRGVALYQIRIDRHIIMISFYRYQGLDFTHRY